MKDNVEDFDICLSCCYLFKPKNGVGFCNLWMKKVNVQDDACKYFEEDDVVTWAKAKGFI